ncbi:unnamed protein product [Fraxinus pennsylvanica]|uniref:At3g05675-like ankyrin-like domain-containing protein n=1 Tax=Fraxinus pennsylvanica TaxID=56036 RepID=A0AAD2AB49_9LAMI|nr:unnamed protein product [Fraxinus pennsylvanica]
MQQRLMDLLAMRSPGNQFNDAGSGDVKLTLSSNDGLSISISVHRQILVDHSGFFALKLNEKWIKQQRSSGPYEVEIVDCDDIEVSAAIVFDAGVLSCLEYLEAAPWAEDEEEKVALLLSELRLEGIGAEEVLKRVFLDVTPGVDGRSDNEVLIKLLQLAMGVCSCFAFIFNAAEADMQNVGQIARQADNLHWLLDILIDRQIGEDFLTTWASQSELSKVHSKVPAIHRYEVTIVPISREALKFGGGAFWRRNAEPERSRQIQIMTATIENSYSCRVFLEVRVKMVYVRSFKLTCPVSQCSLFFLNSDILFYWLIEVSIFSLKYLVLVEVL